ncbi:MAG TPA: TlpA disulfide reductase family protein [Candidatus Eisenbacteria bacterium]|nr:TlpA disulfide reductase family protein [Candidatus Eisenbacteria bacterium]
MPWTMLAWLAWLALAPARAMPVAEGADPDSGIELLGHAVPALQVDRWARGGPLTPADLRGRVVLVRFWTSECHFCAATLPALERLRRAHGDSLVVIGIYHPEPVRHVSDRVIVRAAEKLGFHGPIAVDGHERTLNSWWLDGHPERDWTSPSFLIDREGRVRWVHGGGEYHPSDDPRHARCDLQWRELERALAQVLAEPDSLTTRRE